MRAAAVLRRPSAVPEIGIRERAHRPAVDRDVGKVVIVVALLPQIVGSDSCECANQSKDGLITSLLSMALPEIFHSTFPWVVMPEEVPSR